MMNNNIFRYFPLRTLGFLGLAILLSVPVSAQNTEQKDSVQAKENGERLARYHVRGQVVNASTGSGFAGAQLSSPNLKVSAMTDEQGYFEIGLPDLNVNLYVDAPGFARQIVPVKGRDVVNISLQEKNGKNYYDESVLASAGEYTISGFTSGRSDIVDDLASGLNGQVRAIQRSGEPGGSASFFLRGYNSLTASSQPLFVVDGVIWQMQETSACAVDNYYNNPLTLLSPNDIEKVTVLKNGSAIWGSKGANGVILIETKRGREMATKIEADISVGFQTPFKTLPMMDAESYRLYATDVMKGMDPTEVSKLHFISDDPTKSYYAETHNRTNWLDEINHTSFIQNYGVSVSGGDDKALYRFSLGYAQNNGNIDGTDFDRLNMRFNSDIKLTKKFNILADISYSQTGHHVIFDGMDEMRSPYYIAMIKSPLYSPYQFNGNGSLSNRLSDTDELNTGNPLALTNGLPDLEKYRFNLNFRPHYQINERLELQALVGLSWDKSNENVFVPDNGVADVPLYNDQGEVYATGLNEVRNLMARQTTLSVDANIGWQILKDYQHDLNMVFGGRFYNDYYRYTAGQGYNTGSDFMKGLSNTNSNLRTLTGLEWKNRDAAWYLNADYNYRQRYILNAGVSLATSSRFGAEADGLRFCGVPWGVFPSVSGAWIVSSEPFMRNVDFINNLKLRVAWTMLGNDGLPEFANRTYFTSSAFALDAVGPVLANIGNKGLKWETTSRTNVGVDFSLFNNRWNLNADVYFSRTKDLLVRKTMDELAGLDYYWDNDGEMKNRGFELSTNVRALDLHDYKLNLGITVGRYRNEITALSEGSFTTDVCGGQILSAVNQPAGVFYGYKTQGVFSTVEEASNAGLYIVTESGQKQYFGAGDMHFVDKDNNHVIDDNDRYVIGDPNPDFYGNFNLSFRYRNLEASALFTFSYGNDAYNAFRASLESGSTITNQTTALQNRWMADGQVTDVPKATYGDPMGNSRFSDRWIEDASYLKFKRLMITYHIPFKLSFLQELSVWAAVDNLCTFSKYLGPDPDFSYGTSVLEQGVDAGLTPASRAFRLGVKISL